MKGNDVVAQLSRHFLGCRVLYEIMSDSFLIEDMDCGISCRISSESLYKVTTLDAAVGYIKQQMQNQYRQENVGVWSQNPVAERFYLPPVAHMDAASQTYSSNPSQTTKRRTQ